MTLQKSLREEEIFMEWDEQIERVKNRIRETAGPCGESTVIVINKEFADQKKISEIGRLNFENGEFTAKFAPKKLDRRVHFEYEKRDMFDFARDWSQGRKYEVPEYMFTEVPTPKPKIPSYDRMSSIEKKTFAMMKDNYLPVCVVNPSYSTMANLITISGEVFLTAQIRGEWENDIMDFIEKSPDRLAYIDEMPKNKKTIMYLGRHTPVSLIKDYRWYHIIPSPYIDHEWSSVQVTDNKDGVKMQYRYKDRDVVSILPNDLPFYVYGPSTVKMYLGGLDAALISNFPFPFPDVEPEDKTMYHDPFYLEDYPKEVTQLKIGERTYECRRRGDVIFDIDAPGTYLSRRHRIRLPQGLTWAPLRDYGPYQFSRFSRYPTYAGKVTTVQRGDVRYALYGENVTLVDLHQSEFLMTTKPPERDDLVKPVQTVRTIDGQQAWLYEQDTKIGQPAVMFYDGLQYHAYDSDINPTMPAFKHCNVEKRLAGFPPGELLKLLTVKATVRGVRHTYVFHDKSLKNTLVRVFSEGTSQRAMMLKLMVGCAKYSQLENKRNVDFDLDGMKKKSNHDDVSGLLKGGPILSFDGSGISGVDVGRVLANIHPDQAVYCLSRSPGAIIWKTSSEAKRVEYVDYRRLEMIIPTYEKCPDNPTINGREVRQIFDELLTSSTVYYKVRTGSETEDFKNLLRRNGWTIIVHSDALNGDPDIWVCKRY
jgi:hypothetical protein